MSRAPIPEEYRGVRFRQIAPSLRWRVGDGLANQVESKRPRDPDTREYLDPEGTFITFDDDARIDVETLVRRGHLVREEQPKGKSRAVSSPPDEEASSG